MVDVGIVGSNRMVSRALEKQGDFEVMYFESRNGDTKEFLDFISGADVIVDLSGGDAIKGKEEVYSDEGTRVVSVRGDGVPFESLSKYYDDSPRRRVVSNETVAAMQVLYPLAKMEKKPGENKVDKAAMTAQNQKRLLEEVGGLLPGFKLQIEDYGSRGRPMYTQFVNPVKKNWDPGGCLPKIVSPRVVDAYDRFQHLEQINMHAIENGRMYEVFVLGANNTYTLLAIDMNGPQALQIVDAVRAVMGVSREKSMALTDRYMNGTLTE